MKKLTTQLLLVVIFLGHPVWTSAATLRYALVIGADNGLDSDGKQPFPALRHAQREARKLTGRLVELANFDPSPQRTILLLGATRKQVHESVRAIKEQMEADLRSMGEVDSLFLFFFTGHGKSGRLLLQDGPLTSRELGDIFSQIDASFTIGIFDACYAGSLDQLALSEKGVELTPGINLFRELPNEVLTAEGSVWLVSSGPGEVSYEDRSLGGVFTHYLIEALEKAETEGPGITLDRIWHYTRKHTVAYTSRHQRRQIPQQFVSRLRSTGPLYFSFPVKRDATMVLAESLEGRFLLSYADGQLVESIDKNRGTPLEVKVYSGPAHLKQYNQDRSVVEGYLVFPKNGKVVLRGTQDVEPSAQAGEKSLDLWTKGSAQDRVIATSIQPAPSLLVGVEYLGALSKKNALSPNHSAFLRIQVDWQTYFTGLRLGAGTGQAEFGEWSYRSDAALAELFGGKTWRIGEFRLGAGLGFMLGKIWQQYDDGESRIGWMVQPSISSDFFYPVIDRFELGLEIFAALSRMPGVGNRSGTIWQPRAGVSITLMYRLF